MLIRNASALLGEELDYVPRVNLQIRDGAFQRIQSSLRPGRRDEEEGEGVFDCEGLLVIPGLVNAHTHIGDSVGKDVTLDSSVDGRIHPVFGAKSKILRRTRSENLESFMRNSCHSMLRKGTTTFADFREGGLAGVMSLKRALAGVPIRSVILGRVESYSTASQIRRNRPFPGEMGDELQSDIQKCDGIGISGTNENSDAVLRHYSNTPKMRAIHCAETKQSAARSVRMTGRSEVARAMSMRPHFLIHMTFASKGDLHRAARRTRGIVVCPRANASLAEGIPDVEMMRGAGCTVGLGTDNVMINSPDMFREMDYLWKVTMATHKRRVDPREILKMATVNGGRILKKDIGVLGVGRPADCVFVDKHALDLEPMHDPHAALVHRASESCVRAVMVGGKMAYGNLG